MQSVNKIQSGDTGRRVLSVRNLVKDFPIRRGIIFDHVIAHVRAVAGVSFELEPGETYSWRVDQVGADGAIERGRVRNFTTSLGFTVIDDFESYTDNDAEGEAALHLGWTAIGDRDRVYMPVAGR